MTSVIDAGLLELQQILLSITGPYHQIQPI